MFIIGNPNSFNKSSQVDSNLTTGVEGSFQKEDTSRSASLNFVPAKKVKKIKAKMHMLALTKMKHDVVNSRSGIKRNSKNSELSAVKALNNRAIHSVSDGIHCNGSAIVNTVQLDQYFRREREREARVQNAILRRNSGLVHKTKVENVEGDSYCLLRLNNDIDCQIVNIHAQSHDMFGDNNLMIDNLNTLKGFISQKLFKITRTGSHYTFRFLGIEYDIYLNDAPTVNRLVKAVLISLKDAESDNSDVLSVFVDLNEDEEFHATMAVCEHPFQAQLKAYFKNHDSDYYYYIGHNRPDEDVGNDADDEFSSDDGIDVDSIDSFDFLNHVHLNSDNEFEYDVEAMDLIYDYIHNDDDVELISFDSNVYHRTRVNNEFHSTMMIDDIQPDNFGLSDEDKARVFDNCVQHGGLDPNDPNISVYDIIKSLFLSNHFLGLDKEASQNRINSIIHHYQTRVHDLSASLVNVSRKYTYIYWKADSIINYNMFTSAYTLQSFTRYNLKTKRTEWCPAPWDVLLLNYVNIIYQIFYDHLPNKPTIDLEFIRNKFISIKAIFDWSCVQGKLFLNELFALLGYSSSDARPTFESEVITSSSLLYDTFNLVKEALAFCLTLHIDDKSIIGKVVEFVKTLGQFTIGAGLIFSAIKLLEKLINGGLAWWSSGDWRMFFKADKATSWWMNAEDVCDQVEKLLVNPISLEVYEATLRCLDEHIDVGESLILIKGISSKNMLVISRQLEKLKQAKKLLAKSNLCQKPRAQPAVWQIYGHSTVGKTSTTYALANQLMSIDEVPRNMSNIYIVNFSDKYDSNYKPGQTGFIIDEFAAKKAQFDDTNLHMRFMTCCNIAPFPATKAEIDGKGNQYFNFKWGIVTSNSRNLGFYEVMNCPAAALRRAEYVVDVDIHPDYRVDVVVDNKPSYRMNIDKLGEKEIIEAQIIKIYRRRAAGDSVAEDLIKCVGDYQCPFIIHDDKNEGWMRGIDALHVMGLLYKAHKNSQSKAVNNLSKHFSREKCDTCGLLFCSCASATFDVTVIFSILFLFQTFLIYLSTNLTYLIYKYIEVVINTIGSDRFRMKVKEELLSLVLDLSNSLRTSFLEYITDRFNKMKNYFASNIANVFKLVASVLALYGSCKAIKYVLSDKLQPTFSIYNEGISFEIPTKEENDEPPYMYPVSLQSTFVNRTLHVNNAFISSKATTIERLKDLINSNQYKLTLCHGNKMYKCTGLHVFGRTFLTVHHLFSSIPSNELFTITASNSFRTIKTHEMMLDRIKQLGDLDLCMFCLNGSHEATDLSKFFASKVGDTINYSAMQIAQKFHDEPTTFKDIKNAKFEYFTYPCGYMRYAYEGIHYTIEDNQYMDGTSGSAILCLNPPMIVGLQSGGKKIDYGLCTMIPKDAMFQAGEVDSFPSFEIFVSNLNETTTPKSIVPHFYTNKMNVNFLGSLPGYVHNQPKTNFRKSLCFEEIKDKYLETEKELPMIPILKPRVVNEGEKFVYIDPFLVSSTVLTIQKGVEPLPHLVHVAFCDYVSVFDKIPVDACKRGGPLSLFESLNRAYPFTRLNMNSAAGIPLGGKKNSLCHQDGNGDYHMNEDTMVKYLEFVKNFEMGERPIFSANIKDEVKKPEKILLGKERLFNGCPFFFSILVRMYLMPIIVFMMDHKDEFEIAVGVNCMSSEDWRHVKEIISKFKHVFDGDIKDFDKTHIRSILLYFINLCNMIASRYLDYSDRSIILMNLCIYHSIYYIVCVKGDIIEFSQGYCSGVPITVIINCFIMAMMLRICWFSKFVESFRLHNSIITYGDDHIVSTDEVDFNFNFVKNILFRYGVTYTSSAKTLEESPDFICIEDVKFLKRNFLTTYVQDCECVLCPLEMSSIWKSLLFVSCKRDGEKHQLALNLVDAHKQFWYHGKSVFESQTIFLKDIANKYEIHVCDEDDSGASLKWFSYEQMCDLYFNETMTLAFT